MWGKLMSSLKTIFRKATTTNSYSREVVYPEAKWFPELPLMRTAGKYKNGFPEGAIIHFTAGWQNQKPKDAINFANKDGNNHCYFFIAENGDVYQQFCLSRYGAHAGASKCPVTGRTTVSQFYVGIEVACGGRLEDADKDGQVDDTYFKLNVKPENIRSGIINEKFQKAKGAFETFTPAQEKSLLKLCVWLVLKGADVETLLGHDEVSPERKNDPGLSLSVPMYKFRLRVKQEVALEIERARLATKQNLQMSENDFTERN